MEKDNEKLGNGNFRELLKNALLRDLSSFEWSSLSEGARPVKAQGIEAALKQVEVMFPQESKSLLDSVVLSEEQFQIVYNVLWSAVSLHRNLLGDVPSSVEEFLARYNKSLNRDRPLYEIVSSKILTIAAYLLQMRT